MYVSSWIFILCCSQVVFAKNSTTRSLRTSERSDHDISKAKFLSAKITQAVINKRIKQNKTPENYITSTPSVQFILSEYSDSSTENKGPSSTRDGFSPTEGENIETRKWLSSSTEKTKTFNTETPDSRFSADSTFTASSEYSSLSRENESPSSTSEFNALFPSEEETIAFRKLSPSNTETSSDSKFSTTPNSPISSIFDGNASLNEFDTTLLSDDYSYYYSDEVRTTTLQPCLERPGHVENINTISGENFIFVSWNPPKNSSCLRGYKIVVNDEEKFNLTETQTTINITNRTYCETYQIIVISVGETEDGDSAGFRITLDAPQHLDGVQNLKITSVDNNKNHLNVTWDPPAGYSLCVTKYRINEIDQFGNTTTTINDKTDTFILAKIVGCKIYTVYIIPVAGRNDKIDGQVVQKTRNMPEIVMNAPILAATSVGKNWVTFEMSADDFSDNMCNVTNAFIECRAPKEKNEGRNWINAYVSEDFNLEEMGPKLRIYSLHMMSGFSAFTNYDCVGRIKNLADTSERSQIVQITTLQEVPDEPSYIDISEKGSSHFLINWKKPDIVPGIMTKYMIFIESNGPQYFIPDGCKTDFPITFERESGANVLEYNFTEARPYFQYNISVCGVDEAGSGANKTLVVTSDTAAPDPPKLPSELTVPSIINATTYDVKGNISWKLPCYSHGCLKQFRISIYGQYSRNPDVQHNETFEVPVNSNISDVNYILSFSMKPFFEYYTEIQAVLDNAMEGEVAPIRFFSPEGCPSQPSRLGIEQNTNTSFVITWKVPGEANGIILGYYVNIKPIGPIYPVPSDEECQSNLQPHNEEKANISLRLEYLEALPSHMYQISVKAKTSAGYGLDAVFSAETATGVPENVRKLNVYIRNEPTEEYESVIMVNFAHPCNIYGRFRYFEYICEGFRQGYPNHFQSVKISSMGYFFSVKPEYTYKISVAVWNHHYSNTTQVILTSPPGVPSLQNVSELEPPKVNGTEQAVFKFSKRLFNQTNGDVIYCALILEEYSDAKQKTTYGFWNFNDGYEDWPSPCITSNCKSGRQLTKNKWSPFSDDAHDEDYINFVIGTDPNCTSIEYCNKKLKPGTKYLLVLRIFTRTSYRDSQALEFVTEEESAITAAVVVGIIFSVLVAAALGYFFFIIWKRKYESKELTLIESEEAESNNGGPPYIPKKKFILYYNDLKANYDKLKAEYSLLDAKSKELNIPVTFATFPENKRKNRYTNILTYDTTRVKLQIDEDDEISSDYINASYIKGSSGQTEYIATQGPLELTCKDFWKMVIQERVTVIAMVSQFVEMDKQKCYKYFPSNHETMLIGEDMEVKCVTELDFATYCIRTLQVRKDIMQYTVTHMQFLGWPDFGCPAGTENMLLFCQQFRERVKREGGLSVVHCSAGVGRTGTMISIDMLLQAVEKNEDINIFETVFELRKQRINMVQTEKQYFYIYTCIKEFIENPPISTCEENQNEDPIYENMRIIRSTGEPNLLEQQTESIL